MLSYFEIIYKDEESPINKAALRLLSAFSFIYYCLFLIVGRIGMVAIFPIGFIALVALGIGGVVASIIFIKLLWLKIVSAITWGLACIVLALVFLI